MSRNVMITGRYSPLASESRFEHLRSAQTVGFWGHQPMDSSLSHLKRGPLFPELRRPPQECDEGCARTAETELGGPCRPFPVRHDSSSPTVQ